MRVDRLVRDAVNRLELPFNSLGFDPYGISKSHLRIALTAAAALYRVYFSVVTRGIENVPLRGRAILVGNHAGGIALDAAMVIVSCLLEPETPRLAQGMAEKFIGRVPFLGEWASRTGQLPGLPEHAERLLDDERLLLVFPEGARGTAKLFHERQSLVEFGAGFVRLALRTGSTIIPFAVSGAGEAFPTIANSYGLGRLIGVPYVPLVAYGVPVPFPAKIEIDYGAPMRFSGTGDEDDEVVRVYVEDVKQTIAGLLSAARRRRRGEAARARPEGSLASKST
ncbi:MAG: 1-acyl-sn-glycerol-3-phosphate acyltransferase [Myxococcota bacterium]|nr:1-acyl-sn-glycerol-3-phosphate acyltransferase [Myxococcota bacterium]